MTGMRLLVPRQEHCFEFPDRSRSPTKEQHIYQVTEAVTDPGVTPAQVITAPRKISPSTLHIPKMECSSKFRNYSRSLQQNSLQGRNCQIYMCLSACREFASFHGSSHKPASNYIFTFRFYHSEFERSQKGEELRNTHGSSHKHFATFTWFCNTNKTDMPSSEGPWIRACR